VYITTPLEGMDSDNLERVVRWVRLIKASAEDDLSHAQRLKDEVLSSYHSSAVTAYRRMEMMLDHMLNKRRK